jgi:hypothetical protein
VLASAEDVRVESAATGCEKTKSGGTKQSVSDILTGFAMDMGWVRTDQAQT